MKARIYRLLNIKVSESRHVFDLLRIQLFIGIANSFINIAAFTFFIYRFSIFRLPYVYLSIAVCLLLLNLAYEKLEHHFSPLLLLRVIIAASMGIIFLFWFGILAWNLDELVLLLAVWSMLFYMVTGYAYWGLVSLLFNVRESKRVFSIVGAGDIPAKLVGYLAAPVLSHFIGINNLLLFALAALTVSLLLINKLIRKKRFGEIHFSPSHANHHHFPGLKAFLKNNFFLKNKLILTISVLTILSYNVFNFIDFTFISQIKLKYTTISQLAAFIAIFFAVGRFVALVLKLVFTSRLIERLGIIACLVITPCVLLIFSLIFLAFSDQSYYSLYFFGVMALITEVLRSTIQEPSFFILFQPLNEHSRLKGHIIAKGYMLPPSLFVVGLSLIVMRNMHISLSILITIKILLANLALWVMIVYFVRKEYIKTLHRSIARGTFTTDNPALYDQKAIEILLGKLESQNQTEIIYALKLLENAEYPGLENLLNQQLNSHFEELRKFSFDLLQKWGRLNRTQLSELLSNEKVPAIREKIIAALCEVDPDFLRQFSENLKEQEPSVRKIIIIYMIEQTEFEYLYIAGREIDNLIQSSDPMERELALDIISDLRNIRFTKAISQLIEDSNSTVKRSAIMAACKLKTKSHLPFLFQLLDTNDKYMVLQGLMIYGDALFLDLSSIPEALVEKNRANLIKIAAKTKGSYGTAFLINALLQGVEVDKVVHALWSKSYQTENAEIIHTFRQHFEKHLDNGIGKMRLHPSIVRDYTRDLIRQSLHSEIRNDLTTALKIAAIIYQKKEINRVLELFENGDHQKIFNAMEIMELLLPKKISKQINVLLDYLMDPVLIKLKTKDLTSSLFYSLVVNDTNYGFNEWTKSVCLYASFKDSDNEFLKVLAGQPISQGSLIFSQTKNYVLKAIQPSAYADN